MSVGVHIPTLETERLILRGPTRADLSAWAAFLSTPRSGFTDPTPRSTWQAFASEFVGWVFDEPGHWMIQRRDGTVIGLTGFSQPTTYPEPEMGWVLYDGFEGQGYATEAARAAKAWARDRFASLVSYIAPDNAKSVAVAERLGAKADAAAPLPHETTRATCLVYRHWGAA